MSKQINQLSVIIPVYNERDNVLPLYDRLRPVLSQLALSCEILFINDGSQDGTDKELDSLAEQDPLVKVVHLRRNRGQTAAMMAGIQFSSGDVIVPMDGDMQNDPGDIPRLLEKLAEGYDVVSGYRKDRKDNWVRVLPSRIANRLISQISGVRLNDYGCTLKAYRRGFVENIRLYGEMHRFIPIYAAWEGGRVTEIPVAHFSRQHGASKYGLNRIPRVILDLLVIRFLEIGFDRPIQFFGRIGIFAFLLSLLAGFWAVYLKYVQNTSFIQTPLPMLVVLLWLSGMIFIMMGLLGEVLSRIYYEAQNKFPFGAVTLKNIDQDSM